MHDPLYRLYQTKLALLATVLLFAGLGLLIFGHWIPNVPGWHWLGNWPINDIGSGMFTTGLLGVALQYLDSQDSEARDTERLTRVLADSAPAIRDAVIDGFAFKPDDLARVATPEVLDQIITNGMAIRLGDASFARELYEDLQRQAVGIPERLHDVRISIHLSMDRGATSRRAPMFIATVHWDYKLSPVYGTRRFICLSDIDEWHDLEQDTTATSAWFVSPRSKLDAGARSTFELVEFTVNGEPRPIRRSEKQRSQGYAVSLGESSMRATKPVGVGYTYRTLLPVDGHLLQLRVDQPTRGLSIEFDYGDTSITSVSVLDYIASSERAQISRSPTSRPDRSVAVDFDGWVLPRSGVAFVWQIGDEAGLKRG